MMAAVRTRGVIKRFGSVVVLDGIDLDVAEGQSVGLSGPNGAGRTMLLQILAALRRPTAGEVEIAGVDAVRRPLDARALVTYVDGEPYGATGMTVRQYLEFVVSARLRQRRSAPPGASGSLASVDGVIARAELPGTAAAGRLSTGQRKQLALAAALASAPRVLLLDDPLSSLDAAARSRFAIWIKELRAAGSAIVSAINTPEDASALCDSVLRMEHGRLDAARALGETGGAHEPRSRVSAVPAAGRA